MQRNPRIFGCLLASAAVCAVATWPSLASAEETAAAVWEAFSENLHSITTCDIRARVRGSRLDPKFITNQHRYQRGADRVRWDQLTRGQRRQGVISENLAQMYFDGSHTIQITVNLAGLQRDFSPLQPRGMRCQTSLGIEQRLNDALILEVLRLNAYAVGESLSFSQVPSSATSSRVINDTQPTVRYVLPDLIQAAQSYTARFVEIDFDRDHGWWPSHARFGATLNDSQPMSGGLRIQEFHDLGNGRFFPKTIVGYSLDAVGNEQGGPVTEVTQCRINYPVKESELHLKAPSGLPISVEMRREGDLRVNRLLLRSAIGESMEFQDHSAFVRFAHSVNGQDAWTGSYTPPSYFDYYYQSEEQAHVLLQRAMGTDDSSSIRSETTADRDGLGDAGVDAANYLWIGLAVLAAVAFFAVQRLTRLRTEKR